MLVYFSGKNTVEYVVHCINELRHLIVMYSYLLTEAGMRLLWRMFRTRSNEKPTLSSICKSDDEGDSAHKLVRRRQVGRRLMLQVH